MSVDAIAERLGIAGSSLFEVVLIREWDESTANGVIHWQEFHVRCRGSDDSDTSLMDQLGCTSFRCVNLISDDGGPYSPLVVGGGLAAHEGVPLYSNSGKSAHPLSRHVERTLDFLKYRAKQEGLPRVSTFFSRADAELYVARVLTQRQDDIDEWLNPSLNQRRNAERHRRGEKELIFPSPKGLTLRQRFEHEVVGTVYEAAVQSLKVAHGITLILKKIPSKGGAPFTLETSFLEV